MNRRHFLGQAAALGLIFGAGRAAAQSGLTILPADHPLQAAWAAWKSVCLRPEGRVVDAFQNSDSHSEGQGYGLALAATFGDAETVERIRAWTEANLAVRPDALLAWRWHHDSQPAVPDRNNASDGDLFYAWGLCLAAAGGGRPELAARATAIMTDLLRLCVVDHPDGSGTPLLLPGATGFRTEAGVIVNPSYYMARAMREVAVVTGLADLTRLAMAGEQLIDGLAARGLVPDWVEITASGPATPPEPFSSRAGYDAIRVPLFAIWSGRGDAPALRGYARATTAREDIGGAVTVFDPQTGAALERSPHPGYLAVAALAGCASSDGVGSVMPAFSTDQPYYPATLHLMALVAQTSAFARCVPI